MTDNNIDGEPETEATTRGETSVYEIDDDDRPSEVVVRAVAALTDTNILDLDPLYNTIDPEHVNNLTAVRRERAIEHSSVSFRYNGCLVTVNRRAVHVRTDFDWTCAEIVLTRRGPSLGLIPFFAYHLDSSGSSAVSTARNDHW